MFFLYFVGFLIGFLFERAGEGGKDLAGFAAWGVFGGCFLGGGDGLLVFRFWFSFVFILGLTLVYFRFLLVFWCSSFL